MTQTTKTFSTLRAANVSRQLEWDAGNQLSLTYRANELAGEVGEACNVAKKIERERLGIRGSRATISDLGDELADVIICADLVAMGEGIDLEAAVARKFNATSEKVGLRTRLATAAPYSEAVAGPPWKFDRYINGKLMAEGVRIDLAKDFPSACVSAARIAPRGANWEVPVLVLTSPNTFPAQVSLSDVEALANKLLAEWKRVDPESVVARQPISFVSNFVDMAAVALNYDGPRTRMASGK